VKTSFDPAVDSSLPYLPDPWTAFADDPRPDYVSSIGAVGQTALREIGEPTTIREAALAYAALGMRVVPSHYIRTDNPMGDWLGPCCSCHEGHACGDPGKHPILTGWPDAATSLDWMVHWWWNKWPKANVSIVTGDGLVIIDVDPRHGGDETLARLEAEHGPLPRDWVVETGGGGLHIYVRVPKNVHLRADFGPGVEIKYTGQCVTAPPSGHASGLNYLWQSMAGDRPPKMPKSWLALAKLPGPEARILRSSNAKCFNRNALRNLNHDSEIQSNYEDNRLAPIVSHSASSLATDNSVFENPVPAAEGSTPFTSDEQCRITSAVLRTQITEPRSRRRQMVKLAQSLANIQSLKHRPWWDFIFAVRWWFELSEGLTRAPWHRVQTEWKSLWKWVDRSHGDPTYLAFDATMSKPLPRSALRYEDVHLQRLVALCRELELRRGDKDWFLSVRQAADVLDLPGKDDARRMRASRYLDRLVQDGVIQKVTEHKRRSALAQDFRYIADDLHEVSTTGEAT
jgi:hypothetical protein